MLEPLSIAVIDILKSGKLYFHEARGAGNNDRAKTYQFRMLSSLLSSGIGEYRLCYCYFRDLRRDLYFCRHRSYRGNGAGSRSITYHHKEHPGSRMPWTTMSSGGVEELRFSGFYTFFKSSVWLCDVSVHSCSSPGFSWSRSYFCRLVHDRSRQTPYRPSKNQRHFNEQFLTHLNSKCPSFISPGTNLCTDLQSNPTAPTAIVHGTQTGVG